MNLENVSDNTAFDFLTLVRGVGLLCYLNLTCFDHAKHDREIPQIRRTSRMIRTIVLWFPCGGPPVLRFRIKG